MFRQPFLPIHDKKRMTERLAEEFASVGISKADIIYEFPVEGELTRLQAIFYSQFPDKVGPLRSVRYYFVDIATEYKAFHVGYVFFLCRKLRLGPDILRYRGEGGRDEPGGKGIVKADNGQRLGKRFPGLRKAYHKVTRSTDYAKAPENMAGLEDAKYMHIMGCSLMADVNFAREIVKTMNMLKSNGVKISFDPNIRLEMLKDKAVFDLLQEVLQNSSVLMPGVSELKMFTGKNNIDDAVKSVFSNKNLEILVLKNGSEGSKVFTKNGLEVSQPVFKIIQEDPTGAGDSYDAAFICGLAEGKSLSQAAQMGAAAGALNAASFGPMEGKINPDTLRKIIDN